MPSTDVRLRFLGHAAFELSSGEHRVLIDPFIQGNPACPLSLDEVIGDGVSAVLLTHAHGDHLGDSFEIARRGAPLVTIVEIAAAAQAEGVQNAIGANIGGTVRLPWGSVTLTPAWHSSSFPDGRYGGEPTGLVIEFGGKRVYHAGDTCRFSDMSLIGERDLDVALLPIGDHFTMGPEEAARCLDLLRPRHAVPMHFATFPLLSGDPQVFAEGARARGVTPHVLAPGETLTLA